MTSLKEPAHLARNPFGRIPTFEEGGLTIFESGAIVLHIAERHAGLLPVDADARSRAITWIFAALNTVEPPIVEHEMATYFERDKPWRDEHLAMIADRVRNRLSALAERLGDDDRLDKNFYRSRLDDAGPEEARWIRHPRGVSHARRLCRSRRCQARVSARV